ncbi:hypothetical protein EYC80_006308 [Monilinia laxa]|nr:hypothetical protein EYC80_006308 [Monilinia laxa]
MLHIYGNVTGPDPNGHFGPGLVSVEEVGELKDFLILVEHLNVTAPLLPENKLEDIYEEAAEDMASSLPRLSTKTQPPKATQTKNSTENDPALPPNFRNDGHREPFLRNQGWGWFTSAVTHYESSEEGPGLGENRVKLLARGILSYYSPKFENQAISRAVIERGTLNLTGEGFWMRVLDDEDSRATALNALMRRRRSYTLDDVSTDEAAIMKEDSERVLETLMGQPVNCSDIDWTAMTNEIVRTYASPLAQLLHSLRNYSSIPPSNRSAQRKWLSSIRDQTHSLLLPFLEYPSPEENPSIWTRQSPLFQTTHSNCHHHHTRLLSSPNIPLFPEERTLESAIEETQGQICNIIISIGFSIENIWNSSFNQPSTNSNDNPASPLEKNTKEFTRWIHGIEELMAWLGWACEWTSWGEGPARRPPPRYGYGPGKEHGPGYRHGSGYGYGGPPGRGDHNPPAGGDHPGRPSWRIDETDLWQPRCVGLEYIMGCSHIMSSREVPKLLDDQKGLEVRQLREAWVLYGIGIDDLVDIHRFSDLKGDVIVPVPRQEHKTIRSMTQN